MRAWEIYLKSVLREGMVLKCIKTHNEVQVGDYGPYLQHVHNATPPCQVQWTSCGRTYCVYWENVEIDEVQISVG